MKKIILDIINEYLKIFPEEAQRQSVLINYLENHKDEEIIDWNNFDGHIVAGGFIYSLQDKKFLVLHHKDLDMYLSPGGHADSNDLTPLVTAKREVKEETGLGNLNQLNICNNKLIPIDIDTHVIQYNKRLDLPEHYHFSFRYLFLINKVENIEIDTDESSEYKWINMDDLSDESNYKIVINKIKQLLKNRKHLT